METGAARSVQDLRGDWRRWSMGERILAAAVAAVISAAVPLLLLAAA